MDVEKVLIVDTKEYFMSKGLFDQTTETVRRIYGNMQPQEKLVVEIGGIKSKFEVFFSMGDGIIVAEHQENDGKHTAGLKVTFRKKGDARIDDSNQKLFISGGVLYTYHGICKPDGEVKLFTKNDNKAMATQADRLINLSNGPVSSWLKPLEIKDRYKEAVSTAIGVLKNLPQS